MARVKLSEFRSKTLLVPGYKGVSLRMETIVDDTGKLDDGVSYVIKVDQGIKKRGKQGLVKLGIKKSQTLATVKELASKNFNRFIAEPMLSHDDNEERYISFERTREGISIHFSQHGGVDVEADPTKVEEYTLQTVPVPAAFVEHMIDIMNREHLSFVEVNPLIVRDKECLLLDAAVLADSAGQYQASWRDDDVVEMRVPTDSEAVVAELNENSPAAFSFRVLNPNGAIWLLLSGGGASITIADEAANHGKADMIGNYGEYSGGPTQEETYLYTVEVLKQAFASLASKKAIVIAGGVANFTDVKKTFGGVIQALRERLGDLQKYDVKVFVRRGGPNEVEGLALMKNFLEANGLLGSVHGSDVVLTDVINEALEYIDA